MDIQERLKAAEDYLKKERAWCERDLDGLQEEYKSSENIDSAEGYARRFEEITRRLIRIEAQERLIKYIKGEQHDNKRV